MLSSKFILCSGGFLGASAVVLGAFAAHSLKASLSPSMLDTFATAVKYQMWHASVLLLLGVLSLISQDLAWRIAAGFIFVGVLLFSGSLYGLALGGPRLLGPVTPLGGLLLITGWLTVIFAACKLSPLK